MDTITLVFFLFLLIVATISLILMWHWKTYMPEVGRGVGAFTIYIAGLAILLIALFGSISSIS